MKQSLYMECSAGISGDMVVAALLDLGADQSVPMDAMNSLPISGFSVEIGRVKKADIDCCDFRVKLDTHHENHDHDMEYLHGHDHAPVHEHQHDHHHEHRGMAEITKILNACQMTEKARSLAFKIFDILAETEAKAHATSKEHVHFHEVGAVDSIADITAAAVCFDNLNIEHVIVPRLCEGTGTVRCQHGVLPVPVPAVANIIEAYGLNLQIMDVSGEFVTPTGAAIAAAVQTSERLPEQFKIRKIGAGAGKREYERPSILRAMLIEEAEQRLTKDNLNEADTIFKLESNIDDSTGEALGYAMERLFEAGARDVHYIPVYMKKNRPGWLLSVICSEEDIPRMEEIIFRETTTIGIRRQKMARTVQSRERKTVLTEYGEAQVKVCRTRDQVRCYPEYECVAKICREHGLPYYDVFQAILQAAEVQFGR